MSGGSVANTGSAAGCVSDVGAFDMVGNLSEWVAQRDVCWRLRGERLLRPVGRAQPLRVSRGPLVVVWPFGTWPFGVLTGGQNVSYALVVGRPWLSPSASPRTTLCPIHTMLEVRSEEE